MRWLPVLKGDDMRKDLTKRFTLIEMLVVISIIAILSSLLLPSMMKAINSAQSAACQNNMRQCGIAIASYVDNNDGWMFLPGSKLTIGSWMIKLGYAQGQDLAANGIYYKVNAPNIFSCPTLKPPASYNHVGVGASYPNGGFNSNSFQGFGLRTITSVIRFANELVSSDNLRVRYTSLNNPSKYPFAVDTASDTLVGGVTMLKCIQAANWNSSGASTTGVLHLRHDGYASMYFPDGHTGRWGEAEAINAYTPTPGNPNQWAFTYSY